jgi:hypothetical protein
MLEKCLLATIIATILACKMVNLLMLYVCSLFEFIDWPTKLECIISFFSHSGFEEQFYACYWAC